MNKIPLHKRVYFNSLRRRVIDAATEANIDITKLNLQEICCYISSGKYLNNANIENIIIVNDFKYMLLNDANYGIYEVPFITNTEKEFGKYFVLAYSAYDKSTTVYTAIINRNTRKYYYHGLYYYNDKKLYKPTRNFAIEKIKPLKFDSNNARKNAYSKFTRKKGTYD